MLRSSPTPASTLETDWSLPSFAEAVETHKAMVYSIGWHFLHDRTYAEELAQEVFLTLHRHWESMKSREHMLFWLRKVTSRRAIDFARRRSVRLETSLEESAEPTTLEQMHDTFLTSYLERMVASLPEKQRLAIVLRFQEEMEIEEIARVLEVKSATVKTQIFRGLELLRAKTSRHLGRGDGMREPAAPFGSQPAKSIEEL